MFPFIKIYIWTLRLPRLVNGVLWTFAFKYIQNGTSNSVGCWPQVQQMDNYLENALIVVSWAQLIGTTLDKIDKIPSCGYLLSVHLAKEGIVGMYDVHFLL